MRRFQILMILVNLFVRISIMIFHYLNVFYQLLK